MPQLNIDILECVLPLSTYQICTPASSVLSLDVLEEEKPEEKLGVKTIKAAHRIALLSSKAAAANCQVA